MLADEVDENGARVDGNEVEIDAKCLAIAEADVLSEGGASAKCVASMIGLLRSTVAVCSRLVSAWMWRMLGRVRAASAGLRLANVSTSGSASALRRARQVPCSDSRPSSGSPISVA